MPDKFLAEEAGDQEPKIPAMSEKYLGIDKFVVGSSIFEPFVVKIETVE